MLTDTQRVMVAVYDDAARTTLVEHLQNDGYETVAASCLGHARVLLEDPLDALIVDLAADTTQLVDVIRDGGHVAVDAWLPILAGSASEDLFVPVRLLERGADDVIYEPWLYLEVRARLAALLRRANATRSRQVLRAGALRVDVTARRVWVGEAEIALPNREFDLLRTLASDPGRVFTRNELLATVWGLGSWARTRTLDTHAMRLRRRLNDAGGDWVRNVWGVGYRLTDTGSVPV
jgi:DNA-binding response OmpR family regulator